MSEVCMLVCLAIDLTGSDIGLKFHDVIIGVVCIECVAFANGK